MKRIVCFLALLACLSLPAFAAPKTDGQFSPQEYSNMYAAVQSPQHESNCNLTFAYMYWDASPADYSVYLATAYQCSDRTLEDGRTGVMVFIGDTLIGTVYADGVAEGVDHSRYELEGILDDGTGAPPYESFCEIRVGIKFWPEGDIYAGIQILDFSGNPSNCYRQLVYSPTAAATKPDEPTTKQQKTTTEKSTTLKTTTVKETSTAAAETTVRKPRTTVPVITASPARVSTATTAATSAEPKKTPQTAAGPENTTRPTKAAKSPTAKDKTAKQAKTTEPSSTVPTTEEVAAAEVLTTEPTATTETESSSSVNAAAASSAQMYSELNKAKIVGTALVVMILTAAIMASVFLGMRQRKDESQTHTPQEEYDDFG